jgi:hypothetical protein
MPDLWKLVSPETIAPVGAIVSAIGAGIRVYAFCRGVNRALFDIGGYVILVGFGIIALPFLILLLGAAYQDYAMKKHR